MPASKRRRSSTVLDDRYYQERKNEREMESKIGDKLFLKRIKQAYAAGQRPLYST